MKLDTDPSNPIVSPLSLVKNPMILMAIVALVFTLGMPKLMENSMYLNYIGIPSGLLTDILQWTRKCEPNSSSSRAPRPSRGPPAMPWPVVALIWLDGWQAPRPTPRPTLRLTLTPQVEELRVEKPVVLPGSVLSLMDNGLVVYYSEFRLGSLIEYRMIWSTSRMNHLAPVHTRGSTVQHKPEQKQIQGTKRPTPDFSSHVGAKKKRKKSKTRGYFWSMRRNADARAKETHLKISAKISPVTAVITTAVIVVMVILHCVGEKHSTDQASTHTQGRGTGSSHTTTALSPWRLLWVVTTLLRVSSVSSGRIAIPGLLRRIPAIVGTLRLLLGIGRILRLLWPRATSRAFAHQLAQEATLAALLLRHRALRGRTRGVPGLRSGGLAVIVTSRTGTACSPATTSSASVFLGLEFCG